MKEVELGEHQRDAVAKLHNGAVLCGGVGTGKTRTALAYYVKKEAPRNVIVITTAKKRDSLDWEAEAVLHGIGTTASVPVGGKPLGTITVDSWNNLWKYVDVKEAFFILDEQRLVGSGAWVKVFLKLAKNNHWILLSATPGDTWLDYIPIFVANGFYKNRTEFLREHVVYSRFSKFPKVERYIGVNRLVRLRNSLLVEMPYERHTTRHLHDVEVGYDEELMRRVMKDRWHVYENRPLRDAAEMFSVMRKVANSDSSRLQTILNLLMVHPKLIVFYTFDYELELLRSLKDCVVSPNSASMSGSSCLDSASILKGNTDPISRGNSLDKKISKSSNEKPMTPIGESWTTAEWNGHKHEEIPKTDRWVYLVQYQAGAEAWDCIETDVSVFYSQTYSYRIFSQCLGRIDRMNTPFYDLHYYLLKSSSWIDKHISKALSRKENFNEKRHSDLVWKE